jgi:subtilase-type serine protease
MDADVAGRLSEAEIRSGHLGLYTASEVGPLHLATAVAYSWHAVETSRGIRLGAIDRTAEADYDAGTFAASGEASVPFQVGGLTVAPLVTFNAALSEGDGFTESGADALDIQGEDEDFTTADVGAGVALGYELALGAALLRADLRLIYEHGFGDERPLSVHDLAGAPGSSFTVFGPEAAEDRLAVAAGLGVSLSEALSASLSYDGAFAKESERHGGHLAVSYRF